MTNVPSLTRRGLLHSIAGASALALTHRMLEREAFAGGSKVQKLSAIAGKRPQAVAPAEAPLTAAQKQLGQLLLHRGKHALAQVAAHPKEKFAVGTLPAAAAAWFAHQPTKRIDRAKSRASKLLVAPSAKLTADFGPYSAVDLAAIKAKPSRDKKVDDAATKVAKEAVDDEKKKTKPKKDEGPHYKRIEFQVNSIACIEETDEVGADELLIAGQLILPGGKIVKIDQWLVSDDFDQGEVVELNYGNAGDPWRGQRIASASMDVHLPATWSLILIAGEQDDGGFGDIVKDLYDKLKDEIDAAIEAAGSAIVGALGSFLGPIGTAIGAAIGWAIGKLVEWLVSLFDNPDDFIAARSAQFTFGTTLKSKVDAAVDGLPAPKNVCASPMHLFQMIGDGGHYDLRWHWRAFT